MFLYIAILLLLAASAIFSLSILIAQNKWKRLLAFSLVSSKVIMLIVLYAHMQDLMFFLDVALIYTLLSYIGVIVIANYMLEWRRRK